MRKIITASLLFVIAGTLTPLRAHADNAELLARIEKLESELKILKRQIEIKTEDEDKKKAEAPIVTASSKEGFSIKSQDENFKLKVRGYVQADGRFFTDNKKDTGTTDVFTARRVRPIIEGTLFRDYDFHVLPSFDSGTAALQDAYIEYKYYPAAKVKAGKFKPPFGLERLQSITNISFIELGYPTALAPNRDVGAQISGDLWGGSLSYALGVFNGSADGASVDTDNNSDKDVIGRIFAHPFKASDIEPLRGLGAGIAASFGHKEGSSLPTLRSLGQATIFTYLSTVSADGPHGRLAPQAYYYWGPLGLLGEYTLSSQEVVRTTGGGILREKAENDAWQIIVSYVLTGEDASYKGISPRSPFDRAQGTWGAFEAVGRYGMLDVDDNIFDLGFANAGASVTEARSWGVGLNWYLNRQVKLMLDYERSIFDGGAPESGDRDAENVIFTRIQFAY